MEIDVKKLVVSVLNGSPSHHYVGPHKVFGKIVLGASVSDPLVNTHKKLRNTPNSLKGHVNVKMNVKKGIVEMFFVMLFQHCNIHYSNFDHYCHVV